MDDKLNQSPRTSYVQDAPRDSLLQPDAAEGRDRWTSRTAFILAAIGSAIGLGNFWRFPYLLYKHGGGVFLIPYTMALFVVGIPLLQLEISIGQIFQKGNIQALARISPMISGVGAAAAFAAFMIVSYYVMIIAWVCVYLIQSFSSDLPWEGPDSPADAKCLFGGEAAQNAEYYLYHDVLGAWTKTETVNGTVCSFRDGDDTDGIQWVTFGAMVAVWVLVYLCVFKGAHHTSKVVYVTVILPVFILFVLFFRAVTLEGAGLGIEAYIENWDFSRLKNADIWVDAVSQIFFSLSVSSSVMVSFGSYNKQNKPILADTFIIALSNSFFSIISGFVVWSTLGFYAQSRGLTIAELPQQNLASIGLVFITYPLALGEISGTNFWCVLLFLNLFMLGIDSAFSLVEGFFAVVEDTALGHKFPRPILLAMCILPCLAIGIFYCQDTGLYWFDAVDHYVQYIMLLSGGLHCFAVGWMRGTQSAEKYVGLKSSVLYTAGYTIATILLILLSVSTASSFRTQEELDSPEGQVKYEILIGLLAFVLCYGIFTRFSVVSAFSSGLNSLREWFDGVFFKGPEEFVKHWFDLSATTNPTTNERVPLGDGNGCMDKAAYFYGFWWSFTVKYVIPISTLMLLFVGVRGDILSPYSGYIQRYQTLGWVILALGFLMVIVPLCVYPFRPAETMVFDEDLHEFKSSVKRDSNGESIRQPINLA